MIPHYQSYESSACSCKVFNTPGQTVNIVKQKCYMCRMQRLSNLYQGTETEGLQGLKVYKSVIFDYNVIMIAPQISLMTLKTKKFGCTHLNLFWMDIQAQIVVLKIL